MVQYEKPNYFNPINKYVWIGHKFLSEMEMNILKHHIDALWMRKSQSHKSY